MCTMCIRMYLSTYVCIYMILVSTSLWLESGTWPIDRGRDYLPYRLDTFRRDLRRQDLIQLSKRHRSHLPQPKRDKKASHGTWVSVSYYPNLC